jgi:uncharacterized protein YndB with AHSA1/START domain
MPRVEEEIVINSPPERVFAFVTAPENDRLWSSTAVERRVESGRPIEVGTRINAVDKFLGRRIASTFEVTEHEPRPALGDQVRLRSHSGGRELHARAQQRWHSLPVAARGSGRLGWPLSRTGHRPARNVDLPPPRTARSSTAEGGAGGGGPSSDLDDTDDGAEGLGRPLRLSARSAAVGRVSLPPHRRRLKQKLAGGEPTPLAGARTRRRYLSRRPAFRRSR